MAQNTHLIQRLEAIQQALMAQHHGGHGLPNAVIGTERETFLREFLQKLFPAHHRFATGVVTDSDNALSGQIDIAVEYPFFPSFPMPGSSHERLLLAESVAAIVEVKSDLSGQWNQVCQTVRQVRLLKSKLNPIMVTGPKPPKTIPVFAVGYTGHTTLDGLKHRLDSTPADERPDAALVIQSGVFIGYGIAASGAWGLYSLCAVLTRILVSLTATSPNLFDYTGP